MGWRAVVKTGRRLLAKSGFDIRRVTPYDRTIENFSWHCRALGVDHCFDVGACAGGFGRELRAAGYQGHIISLEPRPDAHAQLRHAASTDLLWTIPPPVAVGAETAQSRFTIAGNGASSSLLTMLSRHIQAAPHSAPKGEIPVTVHRLDELAEKFAPSAKRIAINIDAQGYEDRILDGAWQTLERTVVIMLEMSLTPLYAGAPTFAQLYDRLCGSGWRCVALSPAFFDETRRELLQVDGMFLRKDA